MADDVEIHWLDPFKLTLPDSNDDATVMRSLRQQVRAGYREQQVPDEQVARSVYIVRLTGSFLIAYQKCNSPVLYIGRGDAPARLAQHLYRWAFAAFDFGSDTAMRSA